ncbi:MAG: hypothetical protein K1X56_14730 [Flavobacteriales bacterium]|nr:hypothetical protein [Flavobacteriales bacterium]
MSFKVFTEKEINTALLNKLPYSSIKKNGKHQIIFVEINGKVYTHVKVPNPHKKKEFWENKAKNLARQMLLNADEYNLFISCKLRKPEYIEIIKKK